MIYLYDTVRQKQMEIIKDADKESGLLNDLIKLLHPTTHAAHPSNPSDNTTPSALNPSCSISSNSRVECKQSSPPSPKKSTLSSAATRGTPNACRLPSNGLTKSSPPTKTLRLENLHDCHETRLASNRPTGSIDDDSNGVEFSSHSPVADIEEFDLFGKSELFAVGHTYANTLEEEINADIEKGMPPLDEKEEGCRGGAQSSRLLAQASLRSSGQEGGESPEYICGTPPLSPTFDYVPLDKRNVQNVTEAVNNDVSLSSKRSDHFHINRRSSFFHTNFMQTTIFFTGLAFVFPALRNHH